MPPLDVPFRRRLLGGVLALAAVLSGCAGPLEGVLIPIEQTDADATEVSILVATTRAPSENEGLLYSGERGAHIDFNEIVVSIPPESNRKIGEVQWPKKRPPNPTTDFATLSAKQFDSVAEVQAWYDHERSPTGRLLVFVHGFNTRYESAVYRFAQIAHDSKTDATPVMFTWPSRGSVFDYGYDKESTNYSRTALETLLMGAVAVPEVKEITILAHSMGTWLTVESLRQMAIRHGAIPSKITDVILASPDLDVDVFHQQIVDMGPERPKFTVFVSRDDRALTLSRRFSGNIDRLGQIDINNPVYREGLEQGGITVLDLSALQVGDRLNHSKFAESPEVVKLLGQRLIAGQTVTNQDVGLGTELGATALTLSNTVGSVAGIAITAPIAILDPNSRDSFTAQTRRFGQGLGATGLTPNLSGNVPGTPKIQDR
ncbi:alpha/beta hydrolase [Hoeflea ulvae]|uniref:Alpha/beta hydrolase n=1 Tax=Hoeflea ulvae TaxID=2983764 RepID=A0ABT3YBH7_9HYPH|nr:alpha/beta hydrolase [Hoeflea ulvae]MCY0093230.1 alpha/beta hydrolase [Hoeflea ulvae]